MSSKENREVLKIVVIGDDGVGKTSLIRRYAEDSFQEDYILTIGAFFSTKKIRIGDTIFNLMLWDMVGQDRIKLPKTTFFKGTSAAIVVFDITNIKTLNIGVTGALDELYQSTGRIPIILAGNKADLVDNRKVTELAAISVANKLSCQYVETSAKTGKNVDTLFQQLLKQILISRGIEYEVIQIKDVDVKQLSPRLIEAKITQNKWGVKPIQAKILERLEKLIKRDIPKVDKLASEPYGVTVEGDNVTGIGLFRCGLTAIPNILKKLNSLEELRIYDNLLTDIPEFVFNLKSLKFLGLTKNKLGNIPNSIGNLKSLEILYLRDNEISDLPKSLASLEFLEYLNISGNQFTFVPEVVYQLKSLKKLDLSENQLEELPDSFEQLKSLEELDCSNNRLEKLPDNFGNLQFLINLNLYFNKINNLPKSFQELKSLELLNLSYNQLPYLPDPILSLKQLKFLGLNSNRLTGLPMKLWHLKNLNDIHLDGNPWEGEWKEAVKNNLSEIFNYCRKHDTITVFCSHAEADYHNKLINIPEISQYLIKQEEIFKVFYSEEAILGGMNFEEFMRKYVPLSHVILFFATENSLNSKPCKFELQLALNNQIPIIPILTPKLKWEDLNQISLLKSTGEPLQLGEIKGVQYLSEISAFGKELYSHIYELKREINLYDKEEMLLDQLKLEFVELFNKFIKSDEFHSVIKRNYNQIKEILSKFKNQSITFSKLVNNIFNQ